jgi:hypothetical protein
MLCCVLTVLLTIAGLGAAGLLALVYLLWPSQPEDGRDWYGAGYD